jgi:TPR repeat protein
VHDSGESDDFGGMEGHDWSKATLEEVRVAAEGGDAGAQCALGKKIKEEDENSQEAARWFRAAAEQGLAEAQNELGDCFYYGNGVDEDFGEAVSWFRKAAEQGNAKGQNNLGFCFYRGEGVDRDFAEAVSWFRKAADQGYAEAQDWLGDCFKRGEGVDEDFAEAARWYRKAAEQGYSEGQFSLGACFYNGKGVDRDFAEAVNWYRKAAQQGHAGAQNNLGFCFKHGEGVDQDFAAAVGWFRKAAEQGNANAQNNLGVCFQYGEGVDQDFAEAARWFGKAAEQGNISACETYGEFLMEGKGVTRNCDEALYWLRKCPDSQEARELIAEIEKEAGVLENKGRRSQTTFKDVVTHVRAGDSAFGTTLEGNTLLHTAAMNLALDSVALLYEHPSFDKLVVLPNTAGQLPREVVGDQCSASDRDGATACVIASALSCRRSTRAACVLWCVKQISCVPTVDRRTVLPPEVGEIIARFVVAPLAAVDLSQLPNEPIQLARSIQSSWKHAPATSVGDVLWRDRLTVARSETSATAHLEWLRSEARSLRGQILTAAPVEQKLAELLRDRVIVEMPAEQQRIDDMRARLVSVEGARHDLLRHIGTPAFASEVAHLEAEVADLERQLDAAQKSAADHVERRELRLAVAAEDLAAALQQRLAEVQAGLAQCRAELVALRAPGAADSPRSAKRGVDEVAVAGGSDDDAGEPESKRARQ